MDVIPKDPVMLLSYVNMKLRDQYASLELLCEDLGLFVANIEETLAGIDYHYDDGQNQFV